MDDDPTSLLQEVATVCASVETTLGPCGANKLVVEPTGTVTHTASGVRVLETLDLTTPAAELLRTAAAGFRETHADGTTAVVALTGALLAAASDLADQGLHPTAVERGYRQALEVAHDRARALARPSETVEPAAIARTALTDVQDPSLRLGLADRLADAVSTVRAATGAGRFDPRDVSVTARVGGSLADSELVRGVVLDAEPVEPDMPRRVEDGLGLVSSTVDLPRLGAATSRRQSVRFRLTPDDFEERREIGDRERDQFEAALDGVVDAGCSALLCANAVNDRVKRTLANRGLLVVQRVDEADLRRIARGTGAAIVPGLDDVTPGTLGTGTVEVRRVAGRDMTVVRAGGDRPVYTFFCRSPDPRTLEEFSASIEAGIAALAAAHRDGGVVPGGGAVEVAAAAAVRHAARGVASREQLAMAAFADGLETVPKALARSAGLDGTDALLDLRSAHADGEPTAGIDAVLGGVVDVMAEGAIVEPAGWKRDVWEAATDLASRLVRIDEQLPASDLADVDDPAERPEDED